MPPKLRITKENIVSTAVSLIRTSGEKALNARAIATALNCSTQPIFSNFVTMDELQKATLAAAYEIYLEFLKAEVKNANYPQYKSFGMAYIRFAREEKELFKLLFMCDRSNKDISPSPDFKESVQMIMEVNGVTAETATLIHLEMWAFVHGIAAMHATSFLTLEWELISSMVSDAYQGIRARHLSKEEKQ